MASRLRKRLVAESSHLPAIVIFVLVAGLPITWIRGNEILMFGDIIFPGPVDFNTYRFAWAERFYGANPGRYIFSGFILTPVYLFLATLQAVGLTPTTVQRLVLCGSFFLSGFLTYLATLSLLKVGRLAAILTGLFYTINLHALMYAWMPHAPLYYFWAITPATLALCVKVLQNHSWLYFCLLQVALLIHTLGFANPAYVVLVWGAMLSISLYLVISGQQRLRSVLMRIAVVGVVWCMLNAWWILPNVYGLENALYTRYDVLEKSVDSFVMIQYATRHASILNSLRMLESNLLYYPQASWSTVYHSQPILVFTGFLLPALGVCGIMASRKSKMTLYFATMWILFLFLAKGLHPPLGQLMQWGYEHIPGFLAFRNSLEKLGHWSVMSQCLIAGYGVNAICSRMRLRLHRILFTAVLTVLLVGIYAWPAWTGAVVGKSGSTSSSSIAYAVEIPDSYERAAQTIAQDQNDFFVLVVPRGDGGGCPNWYTHLWRYRGVEVFTHLLDKPSLVPIYLALEEGQPVNVTGYVYEAILSSSPSLDTFLAMLNIGYVVVHNDLNPLYHKTEPSFLLNKILGEQRDPTLIGDFGELSVYRVDKVLPVIYATQDVVSVVGDVGSLSGLVSLDSYRPRQSFLFGTTRHLSYGIEEGSPDISSWLNDSTGIIIAPTLSEELSQAKRSVFEIEVPRTADYELLARASSPSPIELRLDGSIVFISQQRIAPNAALQWNSWGHILLTQGKHVLEILTQQSPNMPTILLRQWEPHTSVPPQVEFIKQNPTRYVIHIQQATEPFLLVFLQTYHPNWVIRGVCDAGKGQINTQHVLVNGYANGWWVEDLGDCELVIEFWPQRLLYIGGWISIATVLLVSAFALRNVSGRRKTKSVCSRDDTNR